MGDAGSIYASVVGTLEDMPIPCRLHFVAVTDTTSPPPMRPRGRAPDGPRRRSRQAASSDVNDIPKASKRNA